MSAIKLPVGAADVSAARTAAAGPAPGGLELRLTVTDAEVVAELVRRAEGPEREGYALAALRLGVMALRMASGQIDGAAIREAGERLVRDLQGVLERRAEELRHRLGEMLTRYFDPQTGSLTQRLETLVRSDGEIERLLRAHLGSDDSVMARTLAGTIGEGSPIFRLLSADEASGLRAQVEGVLGRTLAEQREQILRQFSLDDRESALSRLVAEVGERQKELRADVQGQVDTVVREFSLDKPDSALSRLVARVEAAQSQITRTLTLDDETSALSRLRRELQGAVQDVARRNQEFQTEVRASLAALQARREEAERSTRHGTTFEEQLGSLLAAEAQRHGDLHEATGSSVGTIKNCKKGDHVVQFGPESGAAGARVAWEAKEDRSYAIADALEEIDVARRNRQGQVGVFVFSKKTAPADLQPLWRHGRDLVLVWDAEDAATDLYVRAAYGVARALAVRERLPAADAEKALDGLLKATEAVQKQVAELDDVQTVAETVRSGGEKIADRARIMAEELQRQVDRLRLHLDALRTEDSPTPPA